MLSVALPRLHVRAVLQPFPLHLLTSRYPEHITMDQIAALEAEVVTTCLEHKRAHQTEGTYRAAVRVGTEFFVKFGHSSDLGPEIETQRYISDHAMTNPGRGVPRIPRVLHSFERDGTTYLVMEFINLVPTPEDFIDKVTAALLWLASVPAPPDLCAGSSRRWPSPSRALQRC